MKKEINNNGRHFADETTTKINKKRKNGVVIAAVSIALVISAATAGIVYFAANGQKPVNTKSIAAVTAEESKKLADLKKTVPSTAAINTEKNTDTAKNNTANTAKKTTTAPAATTGTAPKAAAAATTAQTNNNINTNANTNTNANNYTNANTYVQPQTQPAVTNTDTTAAVTAAAQTQTDAAVGSTAAAAVQGTPYSYVVTGSATYGYDWKYVGGSGIIGVSCSYDFTNHVYYFTLTGLAQGSTPITIYHMVQTANGNEWIPENLVLNVDAGLNVTRVA